MGERKGKKDDRRNETNGKLNVFSQQSRVCALETEQRKKPQFLEHYDRFIYKLLSTVR